MDIKNMQSNSDAPQVHSVRETLGKYGKIREEYLRVHKPDFYRQLLDSHDLERHLEKVDSEAERLMDALMSRMAVKKEVREKLSGMDGAAQAATIDRIYRIAEEVVFEKLVCR